MAVGQLEDQMLPGAAVAAGRLPLILEANRSQADPAATTGETTAARNKHSLASNDSASDSHNRTARLATVHRDPIAGALSDTG
jgi:hypothetical protein